MENGEFLMVEKKKNCIECGKEIEHYFYPLCLDCRPYMYKKQNHPHQKLRRKKSWKINREKRIAEANHKCEVCGNSKNSFVIHHLEGISSRTYEFMWSSVIEEKHKDLIESDVTWKNKWKKLISENSIKKLEKKIQNDYFKRKGIKKKNTCPFCGRASISERKTLKPKYRCGKCGKEFENPKYQIPSHKYLLPSLIEKLVQKTISTTILNEIIENHFLELKKTYQEKINNLLEKYLSMENTNVLCSRCHLPIEMGKVLCPSCKQHYIYPSYNICMDCQNGEFLAKNGAFYIIEKLDDKNDENDNLENKNYDNYNENEKNNFDDDFDDHFEEYNFYEESETKKYQMKSVYDKKLVSIFRNLWTGKEWDPKQKVWKFNKYAFQKIIKEVLDYLSSTGEPYKLKYAESFIEDIKRGLKKDSNYRQSVFNEIPKCKYELTGYCHHTFDYTNGNKFECKKLKCNDYFSHDTPPSKIIEIITKLHIIDNFDKISLFPLFL